MNDAELLAAFRTGRRAALDATQRKRAQLLYQAQTQRRAETRRRAWLRDRDTEAAGRLEAHDRQRERLAKALGVDLSNLPPELATLTPAAIDRLLFRAARVAIAHDDARKADRAPLALVKPAPKPSRRTDLPPHAAAAYAAAEAELTGPELEALRAMPVHAIAYHASHGALAEAARVEARRAR